MTKNETHAELPLISTSETVLVPHTTVPLELQPRRYRALDEPILSGDQLLGMGFVEQTASAVPRGNVRRRIIGLGRVVESEPLTGEGHVLYLQGLGRALITDEVDSTAPVPTVRTRRIVEQLDAPERAQELIWSVRGGLLILQDRGIEGAETLNYEVSNLSAPGAVADIVGAGIFPEVDQKRHLLEELDVLTRLQFVDDRLAELVVEAYHSNPPEARERN